jgi:hypothetical protein
LGTDAGAATCALRTLGYHGAAATVITPIFVCLYFFRTLATAIMLTHRQSQIRQVKQQLQTLQEDLDGIDSEEEMTAENSQIMQHTKELQDLLHTTTILVCDV